MYVMDRDIGMCAITETWLREWESFVINELLSMGYDICHLDRTDKCGGGIALLHKKSLIVNVASSFKGSSFEHLHMPFVCCIWVLKLIILQ